jgi:hypothetical protein
MQKLHKEVLYVSVQDHADTWFSAADKITIEGAKDPKKEIADSEYIVRDDVLYLQVQTSLPTASIMTVDLTDWSVDKLQKLKTEHPELDQYWPDSSKKALGISWIRE